MYFHKIFLVLILFSLNIFANDSLEVETSYYLTKEKLNLEQIKKVNNFTLSEGKNFGIPKEDLWIKLSLENKNNKQINKIFQFDFTYMDKITIYDEDKIIKIGLLNKHNKELFAIDNSSFKIQLKKHQKKTIYLKIDSSFRVMSFLNVYDEEEYFQNVILKKIALTFCYGILFALIVYNIFIWSSTRKKEFLFYVLFHLVFLLGILSWTGFAFEYIWPNYPYINYYTYGFLGNLLYATQILFVVYLLNSKTHFPKITTILKLIAFIFLFFSLSSFFKQLTLTYEIFSLLSTILLLYIISYLSFIKKIKLAYYLFISELIIIAGNIFMVLSDIGIIHGSFFLNHLYVWGSVVEALIMSFAVALKFKELEKEKILEEEKRKETEQLLINQHKLFNLGENFNHLVHQLRTPLSQINSNVFLLSHLFSTNKLSSQNLEESLTSIENQTTYLSQTLEYFQTYTNANTLKHQVLFSNIIKKLKSMLDYTLRNNDISYEFNYKKDIHIYINETEFLQVMLIIFTNAKDALLENKIENPKINLDFLEDENFYKITISNNAGQIDKDIKDKIFDQYFTTKKHTKGCGLGLYIAKQITKSKLDGDIYCKCENDWTSFTIKVNKQLELN